MNCVHMLRPYSLTIFAWFLVIGTPIAASYRTYEFINHLCRSENYGIYAINLIFWIASFASGLGILNGKNWARFLCAFAYLFDVLVNLFVKSDMTSIIEKTVFFVIFVFILFRPKASEYFREVRLEQTR